MPIFAGLVWLWCAAASASSGSWPYVLPGCLLLAAGVSTLLYPGDRAFRSSRAGRSGRYRDPRPPCARRGGPGGRCLILTGPPPRPSSPRGRLGAPRAAACSTRCRRRRRALPPRREVAVDDVDPRDDDPTLPPPTSAASRICPARDARDACAVPRARLGREAAALPRPPPPLRAVARSTRPARARHRPRTPALRERLRAVARGAAGETAGWRTARNRTAHAWVVRQRGPGPRPWLICIHGYEMGAPMIELRRLRAGAPPPRHGLNLALPVLPLHGRARRAAERRRLPGRRSARHAARRDERALGPAAPAVLGARPGRVRGSACTGSRWGLPPALLASLDGDLACAIPASRWPTSRGWSGATAAAPHPPLQRNGVVHEEVDRCCGGRAALARAARAPRTSVSRPAVADRLVPADQVRDLWVHWGRPRIVWYQGGHVTFRLHREVRALVDGALAEAGLRV